MMASIREAAEEALIRFKNRSRRMPKQTRGVCADYVTYPNTGMADAQRQV
jgi:hypothetical protein